MPKIDVLDEEDLMSEKQVEVYSSPVRLKTSISSSGLHIEEDDPPGKTIEDQDQISGSDEDQDMDSEKELKRIAQFGRFICPGRRSRMMICLTRIENMRQEEIQPPPGPQEALAENEIENEEIITPIEEDLSVVSDIQCDTGGKKPLVEIYIKEEMEDIPDEQNQPEEIEDEIDRIEMDDVMPQLNKRSEPENDYDQAGRDQDLGTRKRSRVVFETDEIKNKKEIDKLIPKKRTRLDFDRTDGENNVERENIVQPAEKTAREKTIEKMRLLQKGKSNGTYVQCSLRRCGKWRYVEGCEDPSSLPEKWHCKLHPDPLLASCQVGTSEKYVENSEEFVSTQFVCGSMVWAKMKGYPWWPGMVDFCPDTDEYYWLAAWDSVKQGKEKEKTNNKKTKTEPTWYNVVFFDVPQVKRAWIKVGDIVKLDDVDKPPKATSSLRPSLQKKWRKILSMAGECSRLEREERLERFSFAALFDGKWGYYDEHTKIEKGRKKHSLDSSKPKPEEEEKKNMELQKTWKPSKLLKLWNNNPGHVGRNFDEWKCDVCSKLLPYDENIVTQHLLFHHMSLQDYLDKYDQAEERGNNLGLLNWSQKKRISQLFQDNSKRRHSLPSAPSQRYEPPSLDAESLVALSIKFYDPNNKSGATYQEILAFLTIIFPYYGDNMDQCRAMILKVYNCNPDDMGNTRARLKPNLLEKLTKRMEKQLSNNSMQIERTLLSPRLLRRIKMEGSKYLKRKKYPECSEFLLVLLALLVIRRSVTVAQLVIFLALLFPAMQPYIPSLNRSVSEILSQGKEFFQEQLGDVKLFKLNSIEYSKSVKMLEDFIKMPHNRKQLKESAFDPNTLEFYLKSINKDQ